MSFGHQDLQAFLARWPNSDAPAEPVVDGLSERIRQILRSSTSTRLQKADLQPLIRQHLLREASRIGRPIHLRVPAASPWPEVSEWAEHGVSALSVNANSLLLTPQPWHPEWIASNDKGAFADAFTDEIVRVEGRCAADPFLADATGYDEYSCPGQREAVRAAFLMRPGHTLIVNLPTGSGKSLVGQAPSLVHKEAGNLTLFVVPTVALALDQDRQMRQYFVRSSPASRSWPLAWFGGMSESDRSEIRSRIADGTQRILFTSPEALVTSLLRTVFEASAAGMLRYLVIDEAHLIAQWGDDFRPAFQALAGLRNALLRHSVRSQLRTLLLSATFTRDTVETLASLFGPRERVHMVSAVHLRPEPQYWFYRAASSNEKEDRVLESLRHSPRPFILYLTKREDAITWRARLQEKLKLTRTACFHGETPDREREQILRRWVGNELDGIVATSAFGVGIDKADVRTIVHATIPESLDRFYQEVGRGGRDGNPSVSLLVYDKSDWSLAKSLGTPSIISDELGINRWTAMYRTRRAATPDGLLEVDIDAVPEHGRGGNEYNVSWNMRTLLLMVRANLLSLEVSPTDALATSIAEFSPSSPLAAMSCIRLRILNDGHKVQSTWEQAVGASRVATRRSAVANLELMESLLVQGAEVGATLARLYRSASRKWPVDITEVCGGCTADRLLSDQRWPYPVPLAVPLAEVEPAQTKEWTTLFPWIDPAFALIFFDDTLPNYSADILKLLTWLVSACNLQEIATGTGSSFRSMEMFRKLYRSSRTAILLHRDLCQENEEPYSPLSRASIIETSDPGAYQDVQTLQRPQHFIILPASTPDPDNPQRLLVDTVSFGIRLDTLNSVISV